MRKGKQGEGIFSLRCLWSCPPRRQPGAAERQQDKFCSIELFSPGSERRSGRECSSFCSFSISIRVPKPDVQSGLAIFVCTNLPSGSIREIIVLPAGKIKERHKLGPEWSRIDRSISSRFGPGGEGEKITKAL